MSVEELDTQLGYGFPLNATIQDVANNFFVGNLPQGSFEPMPTQNDFVTMLSLYPLPGQQLPVPLEPAPAYADIFHEVIDYQTDLIDGCEVGEIANSAVSPRSGSASPVYKYVMTHPQASPYFPYPAASHMLQDFYVLRFLDWGDANGFGWLLDGITPAEQLLSTQMNSYWVNFARTGNPNGPDLPAWPRYQAGTEDFLQLDTPVAAGRNWHDPQCAFDVRLGDEYYPVPSWAVTNNMNDPFILDQLNANGICAIPTPGLILQECSTAGYVGP
jgi:hypothetical protein